ncbi:MAG: hypothetical protein QJR14_07960 [Bacillota bacterium]|nr:hypothetical protein [Bacillota bacterium]
MGAGRRARRHALRQRRLEQMVVRLPGEFAPAVVNSPSDGRERPVANGLFVYSAPGGGPGHPLRAAPGGATAARVAGAARRFPGTPPLLA